MDQVQNFDFYRVHAVSCVIVYRSIFCATITGVPYIVIMYGKIPGPWEHKN